MGRKPTLLPWDRRAKESPQAHAALLAYLKLGVKRSYRQVAEDVGVGEDLIQRWARRWKWQDRATANDSHDARVEKAAADKVRARTRADWERLKLKDAETRHDFVLAIDEKIKTMISAPLFRTVRSKDGVKITIKPVRWTAGTIAQFLMARSKLADEAFTIALPPEVEGDEKSPLPDVIEQAIAKIYGGETEP